MLARCCQTTRPPQQEAQDNGGDFPRIAEPGGEGEAGPGPDGSQGHIPGEDGQDQEASPDYQGNPPVQHDGDGPAGEDALAPLKWNMQGNICPSRHHRPAQYLAKIT